MCPLQNLLILEKLRPQGQSGQSLPWRFILKKNNQMKQLSVFSRATEPQLGEGEQLTEQYSGMLLMKELKIVKYLYIECHQLTFTAVYIEHQKTSSTERTHNLLEVQQMKIAKGHQRKASIRPWGLGMNETMCYTREGGNATGTSRQVITKLCIEWQDSVIDRIRGLRKFRHLKLLPKIYIFAREADEV